MRKPSQKTKKLSSLNGQKAGFFVMLSRQLFAALAISFLALGVFLIVSAFLNNPSQLREEAANFFPLGTRGKTGGAENSSPQILRENIQVVSVTPELITDQIDRQLKNYLADNPSPGKPQDLLSCKNCLSSYQLQNNIIDSSEIKRRAILSSNIQSGQVNSRIIEDHSIQEEDLSASLSLNLVKLSIGEGNPSHFSLSSGDVYIQDQLEVDGTVYFDSTLYVRDSSSISTMTSNTLQTTTANISNILSNSNLHIRGRLPDEDTFHLHDFTHLFLYPSGATLVGVSSLPAFSHIDGTQDLYIQDDLEVAGTIYGTISGAFSPSGNLDMDGNLLLNIGDENTDFTSAGGLNLAGNLNVNNQFRVDAASGNVGIGTTSPAQKLHVEGHCITGDSLLSIIPTKKADTSAQSLDDGSLILEKKPIKDVQPGDLVYSLNQEKKKIQAEKINKLLDMGVQPIFKLTTQSGKTIRTTGNHPYFAIQQNTEISEDGSLILGKDNLLKKNNEQSTGSEVQIRGIEGLAERAGLSQADLSADREFSQTRTIWTSGSDQTSGDLNLSQSSRGARAELQEGVHPILLSSQGQSLRNNNGAQSLSRAQLSDRGSDQASHDQVSRDSQTDQWADQLFEEANWTKVVDLLEGDYIAAIDDNQIQDPSAKIQDQVVWDKIISIEYAGKEQVYDIEVEGTHNFVANGILAHNTYISGNIGIGTTSPGALLHVSGGSMLLDNNYAINQKNTSGSSLIVFKMDSSNNFQYGSVFAGANSLFYTATDFIWYTYPSSVVTQQMILKQNGSVGIGYDNPGTAKLAIAGNVGIGTTSPSGLLQVQGSSGYFSVNSAGVAVAQGTLSVGQIQDLGSQYEKINLNSASNYISFNTGSSSSIERMRINNDGNVGIGTTSPGAKLEVNGNIKFTADSSYIYGSSANDYLKIGGGDTNLWSRGYARWSIDSDNSGTDAVFQLLTDGDNTKVLLIVDEAGNARFAGAGNVGTDTNYRLRVDGAGRYTGNVHIDGNVGIGTTGPGATLDIVGTTLGKQIRLQNTRADSTTKYGYISNGHYLNAEEDVAVFLSGSNSADNWLSLGGGSSTLNAVKYIAFFTATNQTTLTGNERMRINSDGNVGIGTTSPTQPLYVVGNITNTGVLTTGNIYSSGGVGAVFAGRFDNSSGGETKIGGTAGGYATIYSNANETVRITNGNVGIGTTSPGAKLEIIGGTTTTSLKVSSSWDSTSSPMILFDGSSGDGNILSLRTSSNNNQEVFDVIVDGSTKFVITGEGNLGIGTTSPGALLDVYGGNINVTAAGTTNKIAISNAYITFPGSTGMKWGGDNTRLLADATGTDGAGNYNFYTGNDQMFKLTGAASTVNYLGLSSSATGNALTISAAGSDSDVSIGIMPKGNGNVGIGTTGPGGKLEVYNGNIYVNRAGGAGDAILDLDAYSNSYLSSVKFRRLNNATYTGSINAIHSGTAASQALTFNVGSNVEVMRIISGNVGIGTTGPDNKLQVVGDISLGNTDALGGNAIKFGNRSALLGTAAGTVIRSVDTDTGDGIDFQSRTGTSRMYILDSGNVGIGTTSPLTKLSVQGTAGQPILNIASSTGESLVYVNENGNVGIGTTDPTIGGGISSVKVGIAGGKLLVIDNVDWNGIYVGESTSKYASYSWRNGSERAEFLTTGYDYPMLFNNSLWISNDTNNGNVGIGTTGPGAALEIQKTGGAVGTTQLRLSTTASTYWDIGRDQSTGDFKIIDDGLGTAMTILQSTGNVGIGTTNPTYTLDVKDTGAGLRWAGTNNYFIVKDWATSPNYGPQIVTDNDSMVFPTNIFFGSSSNYFKRETTTTRVHGDGGVKLSYWNGSATVTGLAMNTNGNVGIGTTGPGQALHVVGNVYSTGSFMGSGGAVTLNSTNLVASNGGNFAIYNSQAGGTLSLGAGNVNNVVNITNTGNVGIGTTGPAVALHVVNGTNSAKLAEFDLASSGFGGEAYVGFGGGRGFIGYSETNNAMVLQSITGKNIQFGINGTFGSGSVMFIKNDGNVGIGTTSPMAGYKLDVQGNIFTPAGNYIATGGVYSINYSPLYNTVNDPWIASLRSTTPRFSFRDSSSSELMVITNGGNVGIGTTGPGYKLTVAQASDNNGLRLYGYDDKAASYLDISINAGGNTVISTGGGSLFYTSDVALGDNKYTNYGSNYQQYFQGYDVIDGGYFRFRSNYVNGAYPNPVAYGDIFRVYDGTDDLVIPTGNVGIGTTAPEALFVVGGSSNAIGGVNRRAVITANSNDIQSLHLENLSNGNAAEMRFVARADDGDYLAFTTPSSGNIGTFFGLTKSTGSFVFTYGENRALALGTLSAADVVFGSNGVERMRINSTGNIGIGTTSPAYKLNIVDSSDAYLMEVKSTAGANNTALRLGIEGSNAIINGTGGSSGNLLFRTYGSDRMIINNTGNVGIGTTSPGHALDVEGAINSGEVGSAYYSRMYATSSFGYLITNAPATYFSAPLRVAGGGVGSYTGDTYLQTAGSTKVTIATNGNVGIGTTSPATKLDFGTSVANVGQILNLYSSGNQRAGFGMSNSDSGLRIYSSTNDTLLAAFGTISAADGSSWAEKVRITTAGNVGIGTTSPGRKLEVAGDMALGTQSGSTADLLFQDSGVDARLIMNSGLFRVTDSSGVGYEKMVINITTGNIGIGTTSPEVRLDVSGGAVGLSGNTYASIPALSITPIAGEIRGSQNSASDWGHLRLTAGGRSSTASQSVIDLRGAATNDPYIIRMLTAGTERLRITSTGNVGIGTTAPGYKLDVSGNIHWLPGVTGNPEGILTGSSAEQSIQIGSLTNNPLSLIVNGGTKVSILATGNVGIGTTNPSAKLEVGTVSPSWSAGMAGMIGSSAGTVGRLYLQGSSQADIVLDDSGATANYRVIDLINENGTTRFRRLTDAGALGDTYLTINNTSGNVGIGTTSPGAKLDVIGDAYIDRLMVGDYGTPFVSGTELLVSGDLGITGSFGFIGSGTHQFKGFSTGTNVQWTYWDGAADQTWLYLKDGGNVGIGTTGPQSKLNLVGGDFQIGNNTDPYYFKISGSYFRFYRAGGTSYIDQGGVGGDILFRTSQVAETDTNVMTIKSSGNVGIGTTSPTAKLEVNGGNIKVTGGSFIDDGTTLTVPDYVFEEEYTLLSLSSLENYLALNRHLPGIPSRKEIKANGMNYGSMLMGLLEKTEENTLYVLQNYHQIEDQKTLLGLSLSDTQASVSQQLVVLNQNQTDLETKLTADLKEKADLTDLDLAKAELTNQILTLETTLTSRIQALEEQIAEVVSNQALVIGGTVSAQLELSTGMQAFESALNSLGTINDPIFELDGEIRIKNKMFFENKDGIMMKSSGGKCFTVSIDDEGNLGSQETDCPDN